MNWIGVCIPHDLVLRFHCPRKGIDCMWPACGCPDTRTPVPKDGADGSQTASPEAKEEQ